MRADGRGTTRSRGRGGRRAFTLVELGVVILIIGILLAFILAAAFASVEQARLRATQALISKLEVAVSERLDALLAQTLAPNGTHQWLAAIAPVPGATSVSPNANDLLPWGLVANPRAEVIARIDLIKMEMPDVFYVQQEPSGQYPVGFGGVPFSYDLSGSLRSPVVPDDYILPLGQMVGPGFNPSSAAPNPAGPPYYSAGDLDPEQPPNGIPNLGPGSNPYGVFVQGLGIFGASYDARAALHRLIGYTPNGTDGVNNNPSRDPWVDDYYEGTHDSQDNLVPEAVERIERFLQNHDYATARSEMLYALLVGGQGPLGNAFNAEDFTGDEVKDTDNDGVPEFVDGWGKPLQFYRWPIFYPSEGVQRGAAPFASNIEPRPAFAIDPTGQLVAPGWWGNLAAAPPTVISPKAQIFSRHFYPLEDPTAFAAFSPGMLWDRSNLYARRAFDCKFLILSGGPDQQTGLYPEVDGSFRTFDTLLRANVGNPLVLSLLMNGDPLAGAPNSRTYGTIVSPPSPEWRGANLALYTNYWPLEAAKIAGVTGPPDEALDNIDNHNLMNKGGGVQ